VKRPVKVSKLPGSIARFIVGVTATGGDAGRGTDTGRSIAAVHAVLRRWVRTGRCCGAVGHAGPGPDQVGDHRSSSVGVSGTGASQSAYGSTGQAEAAGVGHGVLGLGLLV
jgi:hypothetical protein